MEHVEELCDDVCILNHGELVVSGDIHDVKPHMVISKLSLKLINQCLT